MKKYSIFFILLWIFLSIPYSVLAKPKFPEKKSEWRCIQVPKDANGNVLDCANPAAGCSGKGVPGHRVKLTSSGLSTGVRTYIVGCIGTEDGNENCTTGNQTADNDLYGDWVDNQTLNKPATKLADLTKIYEYSFQGLFDKGINEVNNPLLVNSTYEWQDYTPTSHNRKWLTFQWVDPPPPAPLGGGPGQKQGTFDFESAISGKDCASIAWDPYGRVFDAGTLEPLVGAEVTLQIKKGDMFSTMTRNDLLGGSLINPQRVYSDGIFNFVVPDGDYKLVSSPVFITDLALINPNYIKAYSQIYAGEILMQRGEIQHRDIAIATQNTNNPPKMISFFYEVTPYGRISLDGVVSHPLTILNIKTAKISTVYPTSKIPYRTIQTFQADKMGKFKFSVDQNKFEKTGSYTEIIAGIELVKVDLRTSEKTESVSNIALEPIPQYLEGYAYNSAGTVLTNVTVGVYVSSSVGPYTEVTTDENGFFKITTEFLPSSMYNIRYTTKTGVTFVIKPSTFLAQNQQYYIQQRLNPYVGKYIGGPVAPTGMTTQEVALQVQREKDVETNVLKQREKDATQAKQSELAQNNQAVTQVLTLILILVLLLGGVVGVVVYLKKRKVNL